MIRRWTVSPWFGVGGSPTISLIDGIYRLSSNVTGFDEIFYSLNSAKRFVRSQCAIKSTPRFQWIELISLHSPPST